METPRGHEARDTCAASQEAGRLIVDAAINPELGPDEKREEISKAIEETPDDRQIRRLRIIHEYRARFAKAVWDGGLHSYTMAQRRHARATARRPLDK